jgi:SHS2 domain-containing protein
MADTEWKKTVSEAADFSEVEAYFKTMAKRVGADLSEEDENGVRIYFKVTTTYEEEYDVTRYLEFEDPHELDPDKVYRDVSYLDGEEPVLRRYVEQEGLHLVVQTRDKITDFDSGE